MADIEKAKTLRAQRDTILQRIDKMRGDVKGLSDQIREAEGPIPDRSDRPSKDAGYTIKKA